MALEERVCVEEATAPVMRPDLAIVGARSAAAGAEGAIPSSRTCVVEVTLPAVDSVRETFLEVRGVDDGLVVTVIEILSPSNKRGGEGRRDYLRKRRTILGSLTSLIEIDLLRSGERMPVVGMRPESDYEILIGRSWERSRARLVLFSLRDRIPEFPVPLREGEEEPVLDLASMLSALYDRAAYDLRIDYRAAPAPPLAESDLAWAAALCEGAGARQ